MYFRICQVACFLATVTLLSAENSSVAQSATKRHFGELAGKWTLVSIYRTSNMQGPSAAEAKRLVGTHIIYGAHKMSSCGAAVAISGLKEQSFSEDELLQGFHGRFSELGLREKTIDGIIIEQGASGMCFGAFPPPGRTIFLKSKNELIVDFEGVFYRAVRAH